MKAIRTGSRRPSRESTSPILEQRSTGPATPIQFVGPIRRMRPVEVDDLKFLKRHTSRQVKMTVPGPFTMS